MRNAAYAHKKSVWSRYFEESDLQNAPFCAIIRIEYFRRDKDEEIICLHYDFHHAFYYGGLCEGKQT